MFAQKCVDAGATGKTLADAHNVCGNVHRNLNKDYRMAVEDYSKAIEVYRAPWYYRNRGSSYEFLMEYEKAVKDYTDAISLNPNDKEYYSSRARTYKQLGMVKEAEADDKRVKELEEQEKK